MSSKKEPARILSIDPGTREMGFALFEEENLLRFGVKNLSKKNSRSEALTKGKEDVEALIDRFNPDAIVLDKLSHPERNKNKFLKKLIRHTKKTARKRDIDIHKYDPVSARRMVAGDGEPTKAHVAKCIAELYPELYEYVPHKRRVLWGAKDFYWLNVFDACTLALAHLKKRKEKGTQ